MEQETIDRIVELDVDIEGYDEIDFDEYGVDVVSIVESPAIEANFLAFADEEEVELRKNPDCPDGFEHQMPDGSWMCGKNHNSAYDITLESYTDYPQAASNNAQRALDWADENGWGSCGTPVGKRRANQLAKRQPISEETIARMSAFRRQEGNKDTPYGEGCGGLMWDAWGGSAGVNWAAKKLKQIRKEEASKQFAFSFDDDKRIATGPLMIPNKMILRRDEEGKPYYIYFSKSTIEKMAEKFLKLNKHNNTDVDHNDDVTTQNTLLESWISEDKMYDKAYKMGFALPMGTWYVSYKINDDETWRKIKEGELKGFSLAGPFIEKMASNKLSEQTLANIIDILEQVNEK